ncbi:hypothetical protein PTTG_02041, partial [Puccinia triticina 1-1 BBBD Race 1]
PHPFGAIKTRNCFRVGGASNIRTLATLRHLNPKERVYSPSSLYILVPHERQSPGFDGGGGGGQSSHPDLPDSPRTFPAGLVSPDTPPSSKPLSDEPGGSKPRYSPRTRGPSIPVAAGLSGPRASGEARTTHAGAFRHLPPIISLNGVRYLIFQFPKLRANPRVKPPKPVVPGLMTI